MSDSPAIHTQEHRFRVLVVDDEPSILRLLQSVLEQRPYHVDTADGGLTALALVRRNVYDLILLDMRMPDLDGLATLREIKKIDSNPSVLIMTGYGTINSAVDAIKAGAEDFLTKPISLDVLVIHIERIRKYRTLKDECIYLRERVAAAYRYGRGS